MMSRPRIAIPVPTSTDFEYNQRCWLDYARAVEDSGGEPVSISLTSTPAEVADLITSCQGVLLPGSPADINPEKYGHARMGATAPADVARENVDELLLQDAHNLYKPILGICYGLQQLNVWRGGTLIQDLSPVPVNHSAGPSVSVAHGIRVSADSLLGRSCTDAESMTGGEVVEVMVNSSHHQAVETPGDNLQVTAVAAEDGVIEALEGGISATASEFHFVIGVQWHPERSFYRDSASKALLSRFVSAVAAWQPRSILTSVPAGGLR